MFDRGFRKTYPPVKITILLQSMKKLLQTRYILIKGCFTLGIDSDEGFGPFMGKSFFDFNVACTFQFAQMAGEIPLGEARLVHQKDKINFFDRI